jgi:excisionase family DNA binding protein
MDQIGKFSVRQAALKLGCTLKFVYDLLYAGRLAGAEKVGRSWLIPQKSVQARLRAMNMGKRTLITAHVIHRLSKRRSRRKRTSREHRQKGVQR